MLEMQAERRFPLLLQTEALFACVRLPALDKAGRLRRRRLSGRFDQVSVSTLWNSVRFAEIYKDAARL